MSSPINLRKSRRAQSAPQNGENCTAKKATTTTTGTGKASEPKGRQESGRAAALMLHSEARHNAAHAPRRSWELNTESAPEPEPEPKPELVAVFGVGIGIGF